MGYVRKVVQKLPGGRVRTYYQGVGGLGGRTEEIQAPRTSRAFFGDDALPPCATAQVGQACASDATPADIAVMDQLQQAWNPAHVDTVYNPALPPCSSAQPGQACNSVTAGEAAQLVQSAAQLRTYLIYGAVGIGALMLFSGKKRRRR